MPLRIAMLGHKRIPTREGGVEIVVGELSTRMAALGHSVTCYNRKGHHVSGKEYDDEKLSEYKGVRLKEVFTIQKKGLAAMSASFFAALKAAFGKYDVVHFHAEGPCAMIWLPKLLGKRCIATIHGLDHQRAKWGRFASWYLRLGEKCAAKFADELIVLSRNVQDYFLENHGRQTVFIPNGVDISEPVQPEIIKEKYGLSEKSYILFLGRVVPEKGVRCLIEAYKGLETDKKLVIAGGSSDTLDFENEMRALASTDDRIVFTGFVAGRELEELYSNSYLYVLPSTLEGMPLSLLEAMSYGCCPLVSDIPECTEVVGESGVIVRRENVKELRDKLAYLCNAPEEVSRLGRMALERVRVDHDWDEITERILDLYGDKK